MLGPDHLRAGGVRPSKLDAAADDLERYPRDGAARSVERAPGTACARTSRASPSTANARPVPGDPDVRVIDQDTDGSAPRSSSRTTGWRCSARRSRDAVRGDARLQRLDGRLLQDVAETAVRHPRASRCTTSTRRSPRCTARTTWGWSGSWCGKFPIRSCRSQSDHYEKLWAAAAEADAPVHTHILTGHSYHKEPAGPRSFVLERIRNSANRKQNDTLDALYDLIFYGTFERHPKLKLVLAESEMGWLPYILQQWDYYYERSTARRDADQRLCRARSSWSTVTRRSSRTSPGRGNLSVVGSEQRHVVERLPALQHDVPELARQRASGTSATCRTTCR